MGLLGATYKSIAVSTGFRDQTGLGNMPAQKLAEYFTPIHFNQIAEDATKSVIELVRKPQWEFFYDPIEFIMNFLNKIRIRDCLRQYL